MKTTWPQDSVSKLFTVTIQSQSQTKSSPNQDKTKCPHLVSLLEEKGIYVSVNHHYGPGDSVCCLGFLIRWDSGSEDSGLQVMWGRWRVKPDWEKLRSTEGRRWGQNKSVQHVWCIDNSSIRRKCNHCLEVEFDNIMGS